MNDRIVNPEGYGYDVCLSFAGEDRAFVRSVAANLRANGIRVFYDEYEEVGLWGKDLYEHLDDVYKNSARYCVMFISDNYAKKLWTTHERRSAQERAFKENSEYILPARFDDTPVPGLRDTVGYIDLGRHTPTSFSEILRVKIGGCLRKSYLPPIPDRLFELVGAQEEEECEYVYHSAQKFLDVLKRMTKDEKLVVFHSFLGSCPAELPDNVHINLDLLRRYTGFAVSKLKRLLGGIRSLGFTVILREDNESEPGELGSNEMIELRWKDLSVDGDSDAENDTDIANAMIHGATMNYCEAHGLYALENLDFSQLATVTSVEDCDFQHENES